MEASPPPPRFSTAAVAAATVGKVAKVVKDLTRRKQEDGSKKTEGGDRTVVPASAVELVQATIAASVPAVPNPPQYQKLRKGDVLVSLARRTCRHAPTHTHTHTHTERF